MLPSHQAMRHRSLPGTSGRNIISSSSGTCLYPSSSLTYLLSIHRDFSWGAKHKLSHKNAGKVWKGFSTEDCTRARKHLYRSTLGGHHYGPQLSSYLPVLEPRSLSSWGKPAGACSKDDRVGKNEENGEPDWYSRYQTQKKKQYDHFMRRMEEDPVGMLFGPRWAKWVDDAEAKLSHASAADAQEKSSKGKAEKTVWNWGYKPSTSRQNMYSEYDMTTKQQTSTTTVAESLDQQYEIDPITNRKVQKMAATPKKPVRPDVSPTKEPSRVAASGVSAYAQSLQQDVEVPVKRFVPSKTNPPPTYATENVQKSLGNRKENSSDPRSKAPSDWLAEEGFGHRKEVTVDTKIRSPPNTEGVKPQPTNSKIESALDRHLQKRITNQRDTARAKLQYEPKENTTEDVDLLRSSDVRAWAGLRGRPAKESDEEKQARKRRLEEEYDTRSLYQDNQLAQEVAEQAHQQSRAERTEVVKKPILTAPLDSQTSVAEKGEDIISNGTLNKKPGVQTMISEKANKIRTQIVPLKARLDAMKAEYDGLRQRWLEEKRIQEEKATKKLRDIHEAEVKAQKVAMETIECRHLGGISKLSTAGRSDASNNPQDKRRLEGFIPGEGDMASNVHEFASRDRWYKQKAPHANVEVDAKLQRLTNDRALIREVRKIYEDTYGTIDTTHRQPASATGAHIPPAVKAPSQLPKDVSSSITSISHAHDTINSSLEQATDITQHSLPLQADPLAVIQRLFVVLREAQGLVQDQRNKLQHLSSPSESQIQSDSGCLNTLALIQKLFNELRQAQAFIQDHGSNSKEIKREESTTNKQGSEAHRQSIKAPTDSAPRLESNYPDLTSHAINVRSRVAETTGGETGETKSFSMLYRILAFDPAKQKVIASKATSLAPSSKEEPLLLVDALGMLKNPGKFLPELMTLHNKGYTVVSGTSNTLVLKKLATTQEIEEARGVEIPQKINPVDLMGSKHYRSSTLDPRITSEDVQGTLDQQRNQSQSSGSLKSAPSVAASAEPDAPAPGPVASESNLPPSEKVRREEAVFSGPSRGCWREGKGKNHSRKNKRAAKRSRGLKNMLVTGTVTAACCYAVGVISQMLQD